MTTSAVPIRKLTGRIGLAIVGLIVGVFLAEFVAKLIAPKGGAELLFNAPDAYPRGLYIPDAELMKVPAPGFSGEINSIGYTVPIRINDLGLRGPAHEPVADSAQWLAIGDSFALSLQVPESETYARQVSAQTPFALLNGGVDGYSTWQSTGRYLRLAEQVQLDGTVLVFFLGNDLVDNTRLRRGDPNGPTHPVPELDPMDPVIRWLFGHSYLYAHWRVFDHRREITQGRTMTSAQWQKELRIFHADGSRDLNRLQRASKLALSELNQVTRSRGDSLIVAIAPPAFQVHSDRAAATFQMVGLEPERAALSAPGEAILQTLADLGIPACDLTADLVAAAESGEKLYFQYDGHWNQRGHAVVTETLIQCLGSLP